MNAHVRDCLVEGYEAIIPQLTLPDANDRHVLAAAIHAGVSTIVTANLADFPATVLSKYGIEAQHPDDFVVHLIDISQPTVCAAAKQHRLSLKNPLKSVEEYLTALERQRLPKTVATLRQFGDFI